MKKTNKTVSFTHPTGHTYLVIDKQLIKGGKNMPTASTKTKKAAPAKKKAAAKTATPKPDTKGECGGVVAVPEYKNPQVLEDLYVKQGMSAGQIAKQYGVSRGVILHHMRKAGITITTRKTAKPGAKSNYKNATWLRKALEAGKSVYSIAKEQGVSYTSVRMQALKLDPVPAGNKAPEKKKAPAKKKTATAKK
jgi:transposase